MTHNKIYPPQTLADIKNDFIGRAPSDSIDSFNCVLADNNCADLSRYVKKDKPLRVILVETDDCNLRHRSIVDSLNTLKSINDNETIVVDCDDFSAWKAAGGSIYCTAAEDLYTAPRRFKNVVLLNAEHYFGRYILRELISKLIDPDEANIIIHTKCHNYLPVCEPVPTQSSDHRSTARENQIPPCERGVSATKKQGNQSTTLETQCVGLSGRPPLGLPAKALRYIPASARSPPQIEDTRVRASW